MGNDREIRTMLNCLYGADQGGFIKSFNADFKANKDGRVPLLEIAGRWLDDLEEQRQHEFIMCRPSGVILCAEADAKEWFVDQRRKLGRYSYDNLSDTSLSLLARAVLDLLILSRYDQLTERDKELAGEAEETNMLFRSRKRVIVMAERILSPEGHNLTGPDVEVLQNAISLEIESARRRFEVEQDTETEEPTTGQEFIGWCGTPEQLAQLAVELQKEKVIASAEAFEGQFNKARRVVEEPCEWRDDITLLAYLFEILKENGLVKKKSTSDRLIGSRFFNGDFSADGNPETFRNLRQARNNYKDNNTTLSGGLNTGKKGVPDKGPMIYKIVSRITDSG